MTIRIRDAVVIEGGQAALLGALLADLDRVGVLDRFGTVRAAELREIARQADAVGRAWLGVAPTAGALPSALPAPLDPPRSAPTSAVLRSWPGVADVAHRLGVSERRARQLAEAGEYGAVKYKNRWRFDPEQLPERQAG